MSKKYYLSEHRKRNAKSIKKAVRKGKNGNKVALAVTLGLIVVSAAVAVSVFVDWDDIYVSLGLKKDVHIFDEKNDESVYVHFIDVGQGDCQLIVTPEYSVMIDCGEKTEAEKVTDYLKQLGVKKLDYVIVSHPHADHMGAMSLIIDEFKPDALIMPRIKDELVPTTASFVRMLDAIERRSVNASYAEAGRVVELDVCVLEILSPVSDYDDLNNYSVAVRLVHGENAFLFTGDIEGKAEDDILDSGAVLKADVLKVAHHGSATSSKKKFLNAVGGSYAVIGVGSPNSYNHPSEKTLGRLAGLGYEVYRTDTSGNIVFESGAEGIKVFAERQAAA
jgi:competence protein ComEC